MNAETFPPRPRASVSSSSVPVVGSPAVACANTQMLSIPIVVSSDDLQIVEIFDDLVERFAVVLDDLTGFALGGILDGGDLLGPRHRLDAEVGSGDGVDRLRLRCHDALE